MDDATDAIGQLSTNAKEWRPGTSFEATSPVTQRLPASPRGASASAYGYQNVSNSSASHPTSQSSYRTSAMHHSPPGRKVVSDMNNNTDWQLQPRGAGVGEWKTAGAVKDFVPSGSNDGAQQDANSWWHHRQEDSASSDVKSGPATIPRGKSLPSLGLSDDMWQFYRDVAIETQMEMDPSDPRHKAVPPNFSIAFPLDDINNKGSSTRSSFGYPTSVFKVMDREDGRLYCLRRLDNVRSVSYKIATAVTERWVNARNLNTGEAIVDHPGLVRFYRLFLSNRAVFFVHDYIPGARTLRQRFMDASSGGGVPLPERVIWSCVTQLVSAIRSVHAANLACRSLQMNHILCVTPNWGWNNKGDAASHIHLKINCVGVVDALEFEARKSLVELQREDLNDLGRIILSLATGNLIDTIDRDTVRRCDVFLSQNYSPSLHGLAMSLTRTTNGPSLSDISNVIAGRVFDELDKSNSMIDRTHSLLASEYDSGRALRLLVKLGLINERPEFGMNRRWTESGDCYVLKLFRDYVFHQADDAGRPNMNLGHVVTALNKLDAAEEEKIVLSSRDGKSLLVVSYADVARCLDSAFNELCGGSVNNRGGVGR